MDFTSSLAGIFSIRTHFERPFHFLAELNYILQGLGPFGFGGSLALSSLKCCWHRYIKFKEHAEQPASAMLKPNQDLNNPHAKAQRFPRSSDAVCTFRYRDVHTYCLQTSRQTQSLIRTINTHNCIHIKLLCMYTYIHTTYTYVFIYNVVKLITCICICVYIYIYLCRSVRLSVRPSIRLSVWMHACLHVCMYVCMYVCIYVCM